MIRIFYILVTLSLISFEGECIESKDSHQKAPDEPISEIVPEFQSIIDSSELKGVVLIYNLKKNKYFSNDFEWAKKGFLPASTFKIANTIIALETGVISHDSTVLKWDGEKRAFEQWEQDLVLRDAFRLSCVPCYREIARNIGLERMLHFLDKLDYGNMHVNNDNVDIFWLEGESEITPFQQIDFLKRLYASELPISVQTENSIKQIMLTDSTPAYKLRAKTGWSVSNGINNGWYVGYLEKHDNVYFFAINAEPTEKFNMARFPAIRKEVCYKALKELNLLN